MPLTPTNPIATSSFAQFTNSDVNVPGAADNYQSFLVSANTIQPLGVQQIGPFAFDYHGDDSIEAGNEVTDHWLEDNTAVQDHIGVKPIMVTLKGMVSELAFTAASQGLLSSALASVENGLSQVNAYLGVYTPGVTQTLLTTITQAQNIAVQIEQAAARTAQIANFFSSVINPGVQYTKQQTAFIMLDALRQARTVFTVYTPMSVFYNMVIMNISAVQPASTRTQSEFTVTMKQLQFTDDISQSSFQTQFGGRAAAGYQPQTSNGLTSGVTTTLSAIQSIF